jgi:hypothetical protein
VAQLVAARTEAKKLAADVVEQEAALEAAKNRVEEATSRGAFEKALAETTWLAHLIELARARVDAHATDVLNPLESTHSQALREHEAALVLAARTESETAFAHAGQLAGDAMRAIAAAIESLRAFEVARRDNIGGGGGVSLSALKVDAVVNALNAKIGADFARYLQMHAGGGEIQFHATFPITISQALR